MTQPDAPPLPPLLVTVRLYVPADIRDEYLEVMAALSKASGDGLERIELYEDREREGFFLECFLYRDVAAWSAVRERGDGEIAALLQSRRRLIPESCEEMMSYRRVDN